MSEHIELIVQIELPDADAEELDRVGRALRAELLELDVEAVEPISGSPVPDGAKAVDWNLLGEWGVRLGVAAVPGLFASLQRRAERAPASAPLKIKVKVRRHRQAEIEYDPARTTPEQLAELVRQLEQALSQK
ncbi:MAG: hypothetical protein ACT4QE_18310 [Anaerolineales bacterium]